MLMESKNLSVGYWSELVKFSEENVVKHYSFDFWNTIAKSNPIFKIKRAEFISDIIGQDFSIAQISKAFEKIGFEYNKYIELGEPAIFCSELYSKVFHELSYSGQVNFDYLVEEVEKLFLANSPLVEDGFIDFLHLIKKSDKTVSLTSNTAFISGKTVKKYLTDIELVEKFDFLIFSDELGFGKPSVRIYEELITKTIELHSNILAKDILHIGDNYNADIVGAQNLGINTFQLEIPNKFIYPRYAAHSIVSKQSLPISAKEYSRFKFGDLSIAKKYALELFEYFKLNHLNWIEVDNSPVVVYSSPYSQIPTSSYYLTYYFFELLNDFQKNESKSNIQLFWGKINRCQTYSEDYGALNAEQRYELIKNDTYLFTDQPNEDWRLLFIDDISITGTHQRVIENLMKVNSYSNQSIFLYYSKLDNPTIDPVFENELNYNYVNSINTFLEIINSNSFGITTRAVKYMLKLSLNEFNLLLETLISKNKVELLEEILASSISNEYDKIEEYRDNYLRLKTYIVNK